MPFTPLDSRIYSTLIGDEELARVFSDEAFIRYMLQFEGALAVAQAKAGIIPSEVSEVIQKGVSSLKIDLESLRKSTEKNGIPTISLIHQLREAVGSEAASWVHWGATSQDVIDTALVLQIRDSLTVLESRLRTLIGHLARHAEDHRSTVMAGRTHSQLAIPITFGLKVAGWIEPLVRHLERLEQLRSRVLMVQLGGAVGTLGSLGPEGEAVQKEMAIALELAVSPLPWHTQRDSLVEFANWLSLVTGSLAKMAQDVVLLSQSEIGELRETADTERGGSSTMPQKRNPVQSEIILASARTNAALLSAMHQGAIQEHERGTHGWQVEWMTLPQMVGLTGTALNRAGFLSQNIVVDKEAMLRNIKASNGLMMAEAISLALTERMGREEAKRHVRQACLKVVEEGRHLVDILKDETDILLEWEPFRDERNFLGSAQVFIDRVLDHVERLGIVR